MVTLQDLSSSGAVRKACWVTPVYNARAERYRSPSSPQPLRGSLKPSYPFSIPF
ncbi:hypothetical protein I79_014351 [Cricetulus griseus]|uniref:Uncharacterized protein n=1 Tax=Cricetulus griseus TaxID=10029 RepID=G3HTX1_CRIGR|nr:hypothetical protein I79_014351 [Cricetulus griseus]